MNLFTILLVGLFSANSLAQESTSTSDLTNRHVVMLGLDLPSTGFFDDVDDGTGGKIDVEFDFESSFSIGYEFRDAQANGWGKSFGIMRHFDRDAEKLTVDGDEFELTGDTSSISITRFTANLIYTWEKFYIPFGLNYSLVEFTHFDGDANDSEGGFGINIGAGYQFADNFLGEFLIHSGAWSLKFDDGVDYGDGSLLTATFALKYLI